VNRVMAMIETKTRIPGFIAASNDAVVH